MLELIRHNARLGAVMLLLLPACQVDAFDATSAGPTPADGEMGAYDASVHTMSVCGDPRSLLRPVCQVDASETMVAHPTPDAGGMDAQDGNVETPLCGDTTRDINNCGSCGARCDASEYSAPECIDSKCAERRVNVVGVSPGQAYGNPIGGSPYDDQLCPDQGVLLGIRAISDPDHSNIYGFGVKCGRIALSTKEGAWVVSVTPNHNARTVGGNVQGQQPPRDVSCPTGHIVTGVKGTTHLFADDSQPTVRQLALYCSRVELDAQGRVRLEAPSVIRTVGDSNGRDQQAFADICLPGAAVVGFTGRSGALIDSLTVYCGSLMTNRSVAELLE